MDQEHRKERPGHQKPKLMSEVTDSDSQLSTRLCDHYRFRYILDAIPDRANKVLNFGCGMPSANRRSEGHLHRILSERFERVVGVELDGAVVDELQEMGYEVRQANAETIELKEAFDAIVAGQLIEHLGAPRLFLESAAAGLRQEGCIIISTPLPNSLPYWRQVATGTAEPPADHTCWIEPTNLERLCQLADAHIEVTDIKYVPPAGRVYRLAWRLGAKRAAAPDYVAVLHRSNKTH